MVIKLQLKEFDFSGFTLFADRQKIARVEELNLIRIYELEGLNLINEIPLKAYRELRILAISQMGQSWSLKPIPEQPHRL